MTLGALAMLIFVACFATVAAIAATAVADGHVGTFSVAVLCLIWLVYRAWIRTCRL